MVYLMVEKLKTNSFNRINTGSLIPFSITIESLQVNYCFYK